MCLCHNKDIYGWGGEGGRPQGAAVWAARADTDRDAGGAATAGGPRSLAPTRDAECGEAASKNGVLFFAVSSS